MAVELGPQPNFAAQLKTCLNSAQQVLSSA
jgi:hypothetical protein